MIAPYVHYFAKARAASVKDAPISVVTNERACGGSPYEDWSKHWVNNGPNGGTRGKIFDRKSEEYAKAELKFLMGLDKSFFG